VHINHLIFGSTYLIGLFWIAAGVGGGLGVIVASLAFVIYATYVLRWAPLFGIIYLLFPAAPLSLGALAINTLVGPSVLTFLGLSSHTNLGEVMCGLLTVLASFLAQLAGHAMYEDFKAPPALSHGFVAAPPLEWISFLLRCWEVDGKAEELLGLQGVWEETRELRMSAHALLARCDGQRSGGS
jgi:hypothetical protein